MKLFLTYLPVLLAATSQARTLRTTTSTCVEGHREQILPGYWVEYKCNVALTGFKYEDVATAKDCAELGKFDKRVCTWKESTKVCIVGDKNGDEAGNPGATCMIPISSPGSGCGGSDKSCNDKLEKCEKKVEALEKKEETCKTKDEACEKKVGELEKKVEALEKKEETCKKKDEDCEKKTEALEKKVEKYGPVSVKCPANDRKLVEVGGKKFILQCEIDTWLTKKDIVGKKSSFEDCIKYCANKGDCEFLSFGPGSGNCYIAKDNKSILEGTNKKATLNIVSAQRVL